MASSYFLMTQIGYCNLVVPSKYSTRGLFSQASSKNIFWQNITHEQQNNPNKQTDKTPETPFNL